jgi:hypothetical protein
MTVNGLRLPDSFVKLCQEIREGKTEEVWLLTGADVDAFGNRLSNTDVEFLTDAEKIQKETDYLLQRFQAGRFRADPDDAQRSGFVKITNVAKFVWFGTVGSGEPFCFDFGQDPEEPSIVTWNDAYWQRVAPDFQTFLSLFAPGTEEQWEAWANR